MSLPMLMAIVTHRSYKTSKTCSRVLRLIDWEKLQHRMYKAWTNPNEEQRCVLFEYNIYDPSPIQGVDLHTAIHRQDFIEFMDYLFKNNNPRIQIYSRRKIINGAPSFVRRQLVVVFQTWSLVPPPPPSPVLTRQNAVCLDEELDDESTTISSIDEEQGLQKQCHCQHH